MQRSCDRPSQFPEIIASELEKPKCTLQPVEDHAAGPEVPVTTESADVQGNSERRYPTRNRHPPGHLRDYVSKWLFCF